MPASQKLSNIARGAIAMVINTRIFWKKMFDSRHIPAKKKKKTTWKIHDLMFLINTLGVGSCSEQC